MKHFIWLCVLVFSCDPDTAKEEWTPLFNEQDLTGWDTYLGPKYDLAKRKFFGEPIGLNQDPFKVFSTVEEDGKPAIRLSGEYFGGLSTVKEYENYHLQLAFKWGEKKWIPKDSVVRDSGLLYHGIGNHGEHDKFWLRSQEFQVQEGDCGDYWGVGQAMMNIPVSEVSDYKIFSSEGTMKTFSFDSPSGRHCIKNPDNENPTGEWNTLDLYCFGDTSIHMVNGVINMILYHSRYFEDGREFPLRKGKIQIQTEGAEVFYRDIQIRGIKGLPLSISTFLNQ